MMATTESFIQVTGKSDGKSLWLNVDHIIDIGEDFDGQTTILLTTGSVTVQESPVAILERMPRAEKTSAGL